MTGIKHAQLQCWNIINNLYKTLSNKLQTTEEHCPIFKTFIYAQRLKMKQVQNFKTMGPWYQKTEGLQIDMSQHFQGPVESLV